jgi:hypothetical protein
MLYREEGEPEKAARVADDYLRTLPAWVHDEPLVARSLALAALKGHGGRFSDAALEEMRKAWIAEARAQLPAVFANEVWTLFYAHPSWSAADAREALGSWGKRSSSRATPRAHVARTAQCSTAGATRLRAA